MTGARKECKVEEGWETRAVVEVLGMVGREGFAKKAGPSEEKGRERAVWVSGERTTPLQREQQGQSPKGRARPVWEQQGSLSAGAQQEVSEALPGTGAQQVCAGKQRL